MLHFLVVLSISYSFPTSCNDDGKTQVSALASPTAQALSQIKHAISLITEETNQIFLKVVLQNRMVLVRLTAAQAIICAVLETECCVYTPGNEHNIAHTKKPDAIDVFQFTHSLVNWLTSLPLTWCHTFYVILITLA